MIVLPLVLQANERILAERDRLSGLGKSGGKKIGAKDRAWLDKLAVSYGLETADMKELTLRVDIIPPSLAIAQAVVESGWGTSRFATEGNALFGQWTEQGRRTMVPADRSFGRTHAVRRFKTLKLLISDDHKGLKAAATRILGATWQRCRVHFARNLLAHAGRQGRRVVSAFVATAFAQEDADSAKAQWRQVADQLRPKVPKLAVLMDEAEHDVLAYMTFPKEHRQKLHSTNPIERLHAEVKRRTNVVGIFPNEAAITRLVGAILLEQNDEWAVSRRYMTLESIAPLSDGVPITLPTVAA